MDNSTEVVFVLNPACSNVDVFRFIINVKLPIVMCNRPSSPVYELSTNISKLSTIYQLIVSYISEISTTETTSHIIVASTVASHLEVLCNSSNKV